MGAIGAVRHKFPAFSWAIIRYILVAGICFVIIYPLLVKISTSVMSLEDILDAQVRWIPKYASLDSYRISMQVMNYPQALLNSLVLATLVSILQLASSTVVGYGLARYKFFGRPLVFGLAIFTLVVPPQLIGTPLYLNFRFFSFFGLSKTTYNLLNSYWPFVLTSLTASGFRNGLFIFIMRQFFRGMPQELEEAAYVDGAGPFKCFVKIMLPGAVSAMVIVFLFAFVWQWNDYYHTWMYLRDTNVLPIALQNLVQNYSELPDAIKLRPYVTVLNNAGSILLMAPLIVLYAFAQRYFLESVSRTGLVG